MFSVSSPRLLCRFDSSSDRRSPDHGARLNFPGQPYSLTNHSRFRSKNFGGGIPRRGRLPNVQAARQCKPACRHDHEQDQRSRVRDFSSQRSRLRLDTHGSFGTCKSNRLPKAGRRNRSISASSVRTARIRRHVRPSKDHLSPKLSSSEQRPAARLAVGGLVPMAGIRAPSITTWVPYWVHW